MLDAEQLTSGLTEIEAQLAHSLTQVQNQRTSVQQKSGVFPAQILIGRNLQASPTKDTHVTDHTLHTLFQYHQRLVSGFGSAGVQIT